MKKGFAILAVLALVAVGFTACESTGGAAAAKGPSIRLRAKDAVITARGGEGVHLEAGGNVGYWSSTDDTVEWEYEIEEAGDYSVIVEYSVASSFKDAEVNVDVSGTVLAWTVENTREWSNYKKVDIGTVSLEEGANTLTMQATKIINRFVANVMSVTLEKQE